MIMSVLKLSQLWDCEVQLTEGIETNKLIQDYVDPTWVKKRIYEMPVIRANGLKVAAGKAYFRHRKIQAHIRLHPALYDDKDQVVNQRLETFFHEIAHQIAYIVKHDRGHGSYWAYCLMHFGFAAERCYDGRVHNFRGYEKRKENREVDEIFDALPELEL